MLKGTIFFLNAIHFVNMVEGLISSVHIRQIHFNLFQYDLYSALSV